jgi:hypothetical protein
MARTEKQTPKFEAQIYILQNPKFSPVKYMVDKPSPVSVSRVLGCPK